MLETVGCDTSGLVQKEVALEKPQTDLLLILLTIHETTRIFGAELLHDNLSLDIIGNLFHFTKRNITRRGLELE